MLDESAREKEWEISMVKIVKHQKNTILIGSSWKSQLSDHKWCWRSTEGEGGEKLEKREGESDGDEEDRKLNMGDDQMNIALL